MKRWIACAILLIVAACNNDSGMETRTYSLSQLDADQAITILTPYIRSGGTLAARGKIITIRERPDRLKVIEQLLDKYDGAGTAVDVMLHIDVVQADGFREKDSTLAAIEPLLRKTFRYSGFRSLGQSDVRVRELGTFNQSQPPYFKVAGRLSRIEKVGADVRVPLEISVTVTQNDRTGLAFGDDIATVVTTTMGKPMVLGKSIRNGALILIVTPSLAPM